MLSRVTADGHAESTLMSATPLVSVIMPVRNGGAWLEQAVASILSQSFTDLELIIVDDHSTDDALTRLVHRDPRLKILASDGEGIVAALNHGIAQSRGRFLARMDADDIAVLTRIASQLEYLERHPDVGICGARVTIFSGVPGESAAEGYRVYEEWINGLTRPEDIARQIYVESPIPHPTAMLRREVMQKLGGYRDTPWAEDYDLWLRAHVAGVRMGKPHECLLHWRDHDGRLSRQSARYSREQFTAARACYLAQQYAGRREVVIWGAGESGKRLCDALTDHALRPRAFIDVNPRLIGGHKRGLPVLAMEEIDSVGNALILAAVARRGARAEIRAWLEENGRREGTDYIFAA